MTIECDKADTYRQRSRKNKRKSEVLVTDDASLVCGGPKLSWSSLEDINDPEAVWPKAVGRVAAAACKDQTAAEIFHQVGDELGKMGASSVFLTKEVDGGNLLISNVTVSPSGTTVYPAKALHANKSKPVFSESEAIGHVFASGNPVLTTDFDESLKQLFPELAADNLVVSKHTSFVYAPLSNASGVFGVLIVAAPDMTYIKTHNVMLLAHIASMSYQRSRMVNKVDAVPENLECLYSELDSAGNSRDKSLQDLVHALTVSMEKRDPYTFDHQLRVTRLALAIAEEMGLEQDKIDGLRIAASVHDIGKIVIPFEILNRSSRISESEFALIKIHPQMGFDMLSPISFRWPVAEIVWQHHERIDGSGYPRGLKDDQILLEAKILAVADVIEAMSSHRPYRIAPGINVALEEVSNKSGVLYDADAVDACIRLLLIKNFSRECGIPSAWQSANPFKSLIITEG
jgi:HD-GYP domain-containing protein (c-di-GMP phosphodiesterase class II)